MSRTEHIDTLLEGFAKDKLAGCCCAAAKDGKIIYEKYAGYADAEKGVPFGADTVCRLYSMTKIVVCTAAMMLFERGKFLLNDPFSEYFPEFAYLKVAKRSPNGQEYTEEAKNPLLVKHVFSMSCGLPYPNEESMTGRKMLEEIKNIKIRHGSNYDLQTLVKAMAEVPLALEPGTYFLYGFGHELVAGLIEKVSGKSLGEFLKEEIFEPLGMTDTGYRFFGDISSRMAAMYEADCNGKLINAGSDWDDTHDPSCRMEGGGSGLFSTLRDYLAFTQMLACGGTYNGERIIGSNTIDLMRRNQLDETQLRDFRNPYLDGYGYGLGVRVMMDPAAGNSNAPVGEFGWTGMAGTWASICPEERFSAVYMHQRIPNEEVYHHLRVRAAVYGLI